jgi:putative ABC transport system permease protein
LVTESLVLAVLGGALGILLSRWTTQLLENLITHTQLLRMRPFAVDGSALVFTTAVTLATGMLFSLWPAFLATRFEITELLRGAAPRQRLAASRPLVVAEVALAVILLTGAGLTLRSWLRLAAIDRGLDVRGVLTMQIGLPGAKYREPSQIVDFFDRVLERVQALPGVVSVSAVNYPPTGLIGTGVNFVIEGHPPAGPGENLFTRYWLIDPAYFRTMRIPLLAGRDFTAADADLEHGSVIINENMAQRFWPDAGRRDAALGRKIRLEFPRSDAFWLPHAGERPLTIVGVVGNVREDGPDAAMPQVYLPYRQNPLKIMHLLVRASGGDPVSLAHAVQDEVTAVDPNQPISEIRTMEQVAAETFSQRRVFGALLGVFAVLALGLAALGIYGLVTYSVAERTPEIGVRMALGAQRRDVFGLILGQAMQLVLAGVALGLAGAYLMGRLLTGLVFGIEPSDPTVFVGVPLALIIVALLAGSLPVRRATRIDPIQALRQD